MKRVLHLIALLFISFNLLAQAPQKMTYQAVIRNASNNLVVNAPIKIRITILQGTVTGTSVYSEVHSATTNANGLVSLEIGEGTDKVGTFSTINWGNGPFYLKTETDPNNGSNYTIIGTSQLLSVPYSLFSGNGIPGGGAQNQTLSWCNGTPTWGLCVPKLVTTQASNITSSTATSGGTITDDAGNSVTVRGIVWSTTSSPTIALTTKTSDGSGTGTYPSNLTGLAPVTTYYVRAYATNSAGTAYGNEVSFTTSPALPTITTSVISGVTSSTAISGGNITNNGGAAVTARGIVWSTSQNPTLASNNGSTTDGTGNGAFASNLSGLTPATTYYVRAYATNSAGTAYGNQVSFTTTAVLPSLITTSVSSITGNTAVSGGDITNNGGATVTARGVVWSTSPNPTISLTTKTSDGTGSGIFVSNLTNLQPVTTYYIRAYATNSIGTAYGNEISFTTTVALPTLSTTAVTSISETGAISGGNITNNGGAAVTTRGVVWSTSPNPTIALTTKTSDGGGSGAFASNLSGLTNNTTYYVRAYATNSAGTAYGNELSFKTTAPPPTTINNGLVGFWPFNGNANDESGNGNNGTVNGATLTTDRFGNNNKAFYFSSSGCATRIDVNVNTTSITSGLTMSVWVMNVGAGCIGPRLLEFWPGSDGPGMSQWGTDYAQGLWGIGSITSSGFGCYTSLPMSANNVWAHLVYTNDGTVGKFYKDGVLIKSIPSNGNPILASSAAFGRMNHPAFDAYNGKLDDIRIYNRALTQEEITYLANN